MKKLFMFSLFLGLLITLSGCNSDEYQFTNIPETTVSVGEVIDLTNGVDITLGGVSVDEAVITATPNSLDTSQNHQVEVQYKALIDGQAIYTQTITYHVVDYASGSHPVITGLNNIQYFIGEELPNYLNGVTAYDATYGDITGSIIVDDSQVNYNQIGTYQVTYFVENHDGYQKMHHVTVNVHIHEPGVLLDNDMLIFEQNRQNGIMDENGDIIIPALYDDIDYLGDNMIRLLKDEEVFYYNVQTNQYLEYDYDPIYFYDGISVVENNNQYGYMDIDGDMITPIIYDMAQPFNEDGYAKVGFRNGDTMSPKSRIDIDDDRMYGYINTNGETVIPMIYSMLSILDSEASFEESYFIAIISGSRYSLAIDYQNNVLYELNGYRWDNIIIGEESYYILPEVDGELLVNEDLTPYQVEGFDAEKYYVDSKKYINDDVIYLLVDTNEQKYITNANNDYFKTTNMTSLYNISLEDGYYLDNTKDDIYVFDMNFTERNHFDVTTIQSGYTNFSQLSTIYNMVTYSSYNEDQVYVMHAVNYNSQTNQFTYFKYTQSTHLEGKFDYFIDNSEETAVSYILKDQQIDELDGVLYSYQAATKDLYLIYLNDGSTTFKNVYSLDNGLIIDDPINSFYIGEECIYYKQIDVDTYNVYSTNGVRLLSGLVSVSVRDDHTLVVSNDLTKDNPYQIYNLDTKRLTTDSFYDVNVNDQESHYVVVKNTETGLQYGLLDANFNELLPITIDSYIVFTDYYFQYWIDSVGYVYSLEEEKVFTNDYNNREYVNKLLRANQVTDSSYKIYNQKEEMILDETTFGDPINSLMHAHDEYYIINNGTSTMAIFNSLTKEVYYTNSALYYEKSGGESFLLKPYSSSTYGNIYLLDDESNEVESVHNSVSIDGTFVYEDYYYYEDGNYLFYKNTGASASYVQAFRFDGDFVYIDTYSYMNKLYVLEDNELIIVHQSYQEIVDAVKYNHEEILVHTVINSTQDTESILVRKNFYGDYTTASYFTNIIAYENDLIITLDGNDEVDIYHRDTDGNFIYWFGNLEGEYNLETLTFVTGSIEIEITSPTQLSTNLNEKVYNDVWMDPYENILFLYQEENIDAYIQDTFLREDTSDDIYILDEDLYIELKENESSLFTSQENIITYEADAILPFEEGLDYFAFIEYGRVGLINDQGTILIDALYDYITIYDDYIIAESSDMYQLFDLNGNPLSDLEYSDVILLHEEDEGNYILLPYSAK